VVIAGAILADVGNCWSMEIGRTGRAGQSEPRKKRCRHPFTESRWQWSVACPTQFCPHHRRAPAEGDLVKRTTEAFIVHHPIHGVSTVQDPKNVKSRVIV